MFPGPEPDQRIISPSKLALKLVVNEHGGGLNISVITGFPSSTVIDTWSELIPHSLITFH